MNFQKNLQSQNGWYRYDVRFAMPVYDEETLVSVVKPHQRKRRLRSVQRNLHRKNICEARLLA